MIYVDTSVVLAQLLAEDRKPPADLWSRSPISSRLITYECWTRVHARGLADSHGDALQATLATLDLLELSPIVLSRALEPFPVAVRTLDALHLASVEFLRSRRVEVSLATYDSRMTEAARQIGIQIDPLTQRDR